MHKCKALLCPTNGTPHDVAVPFKSLGLDDQPELQRVLGAPDDNLRRVSIWQDGAIGKGLHTSLEIFCREWHGLEARALINRNAPHIQVLVLADQRYCFSADHA